MGGGSGVGPAAEVLGAAFWGETRKQTGGEKQAQGDPRTLLNPGRSHAEVLPAGWAPQNVTYFPLVVYNRIQT